MVAKLIGLVSTVVVLASVAVFATAVLITAVVLYGVFRGGRAVWRRYQEHVMQMHHQRAELLARAELQHRWYLDGDPRGTYGRYAPAQSVSL